MIFFAEEHSETKPLEIKRSKLLNQIKYQICKGNSYRKHENESQYAMIALLKS